MYLLEPVMCTQIPCSPKHFLAPLLGILPADNIQLSATPGITLAPESHFVKVLTLLTDEEHKSLLFFAQADIHWKAHSCSGVLHVVSLDYHQGFLLTQPLSLPSPATVPFLP